VPMDLDAMKRAIEDAGYLVTPPANEKQELFDLSGLTVRQAAARSGVSYPQVCQWSRGNLELRAEQEANVRRVLLEAVRKRQARMDALVSGKGESDRHAVVAV
jgi:hypothetical protein